MPNYPLRRTIAASATVGTGAAGLQVLGDTDPSYVPKITEKFIDNPEGGGSVLSRVHDMVPPVPMPLNEVLANAAETGVKAAVITAGVMGVHYGIKHFLGRQWNKGK